jgi:hypothetical protein
MDTPTVRYHRGDALAAAHPIPAESPADMKLPIWIISKQAEVAADYRCYVAALPASGFTVTRHTHDANYGGLVLQSGFADCYLGLTSQSAKLEKKGF